MQRTREIWIDYIKLFACVLVTLGHFFQSMTQAGIVPTSAWTHWFDTTVYYFHVPLFFVCSGYLYQAFGRIENITDWKNNVFKKLITLGVPYFTFSIVTWVLKNVFSGAVNAKTEGFLKTLFLAPLSPYWFLYVLFFFFALIPTLRGKNADIVAVAVAVLCKLISTGIELPVYLVQNLCSNGVWFVAGMALSATGVMKKIHGFKWLAVSSVLATAFLVGSMFLYNKTEAGGLVSFLMGIVGCLASVIGFRCVFTDGVARVTDRLVKYTMPVFLMHTIFAAGWRSVLFGLGVSNAPLHIITGIAISFIAPVVMAVLMKRIKYLDFVLNPGRYLLRKS